MSLQPGTRLGPYGVVALLGAGGMGEVYRARDTTLGRDVAIKALPASVGADPERVTRFQREAQLLAALNHPHIATIHGIVEAQGSTFIILELVEGESLAQRLERGPIPVPEALVIARQVADALQAAHMKGIIHRDLKPGNVMLTPEARVKVLDFGLAKAVDPSDSASATYVPNSPTFTSPPTQMGMILGTAAYMAPEQAKGKPVDKRADVWAFGCLFYEMLTGRRPFEGEDVTDTIAAVMRGEPDWSALPPDLSPVVERYLRRCLEKQPNLRVQDIGDMRLALDGAFDVPSSPGAGAASPLMSRRVLGGAIAVAALVSGATVWMVKPAPPQRPAAIHRFTISSAPASLALANTNRDFALSPDGSTIVYLARGAAEGSRQFYLRRLDSLAATPLRTDARAFEPFFSPDGQWIGFNDETDFTIRKMPLSGGTPTAIAKIGREMLGAAWGDDDTIVYATNEGLWRVPAAGGTPPESLAKAEPDRGGRFGWPEFLPGSRTVLVAFRSGARAEDSGIAALDMASRRTTVLIHGGSSPRYSTTGHLLYTIDAGLRAVGFDPVKVEVHGTPVLVLDGVISKPSGSADVAIARDGTLVYVGGGAIGAQRLLVWVDRDGTRHPIKAPPRAYTIARISPDGTRIALDVRDQGGDVWVWDIKRETLSRLTTTPGSDGLPVWTRDSRRIVFASERNGAHDLFIAPADGSAEATRLFESATTVSPASMTPDGSHLILRHVQGSTGQDITMFPFDGNSKGSGERTLVATTAIENNGEVSPDGRWLAYESNESGDYEIYVRPFPNVSAGRWQVSAAGGFGPIWAPDGRELFFVSRDSPHLLSVHVAPGALFQASPPKAALAIRVFSPISARGYDISPDGRRFVVIEDAAVSDPQSAMLTVVANWAEELKRLVPVR